MSSFDPSTLDRFPQESGVYLMKNSRGEVIYVGKALHLKTRIKQYFAKAHDGRAMIPFLLTEIASIDTIVVPSEKEALLLESTLIKKHKPKFNALLKDDKNFVSLMINHKHPWPMIRLIRHKGKLNPANLYFGPYTSAFAARQTLDLLSRLFPLRQCSDEELKRRARPCILHSIKRCIAPCVKKCTAEEYATYVHSAIDFLKGNDKKILQELQKAMDAASDALEFEKADSFLQTIRQIEHVIQGGGIVLRPTGRDCDAIALYQGADKTILTQLFFREGKLISAKNYPFNTLLGSKEEILSSLLVQLYANKKEKPEEVLLPFPLPNHHELAKLLSLHILFPKVGEKKKILEMAFKNAEASFNREKDERAEQEKILLDLQEKCHLQNYPEKIECFDASNIAGTDLVACMVGFKDGLRDKQKTRYFKIRDIPTGDDYAALRQALKRRLTKAKEEQELPDLIVIDGGKGQLSSALSILKELNIISIDLIALSKEEGRHDRGMTKEKIYHPNGPEPLILEARSPLLFFLQKVRDTAHTKVLEFHKARRSKRIIKTSLDEIKGIGPSKRQKLLKHFGSVDRIRRASEEELQSLEGISAKDANLIFKHFN